MFLLLTIACLFIGPISTFFLTLVFREKKVDEQKEAVSAQLAQIDGGVWERMSVFAHIERGLNKNPNGPAVICTFQAVDHLENLVSGRGEVTQPTALWQQQNGCLCPAPVQLPPKCLSLTYTQVHRTALKLAAGLLANGAQPNTTMVMLIPNGAEYTLLLWTCILLRITYVSLDPTSLDISGFTALKYVVQILRPQLVVAPDAVSGRALDVAMSELQLPKPIRICLSYSLTPGWKSLTDIAASAEKCPVDEATLVAAARHDNQTRIHSIMFTSGTSGRPKACPQRVAGMSHALHSQSWLIDQESGAFAVQQTHNSRGIAPAQTLQTWRSGGAVVMTGQGFSVRDAAEAIRQFGATFIVLTPPMVHEMAVELAARPLDVSSVVRIQVGGDAVTKGVLTKCVSLFPRAQVCVNHGMTEGPGSFVWPFFNRPVSKIPFFGEICPVGTVAPGSIVRIWDPVGKCVVGRGELGELHISCTSIIRHYFGGMSEESFYDDRNGRWFKTGDIAMVDKHGVVFILGRRADMIKRGDVVIMPAAIESSIEAFTGAQTIVVAAPHPVLGAEPFAILDSYNGKTEACIKHHVQVVFGRDYALGGLASLKQLGLVEFPLNATRKIIKSEVQRAVAKHLIKISERSDSME